MRFSTVLAVTFAMALADAAPVVQTEGAVPDVPHRDPADYYKVVAALRTEPAKIPLQKTGTGAPEATEGITAQQAKRGLKLGDPAPSWTKATLPQLFKTKDPNWQKSTNPFENPYFRFRLMPCWGFCDHFVRKDISILGLLLCPCTLTNWNSHTSTTAAPGPKRTGMPLSTTTEGHVSKVTGKSSSTTTEGHGPKVTGMPSSTITEAHGPKVTGMPSPTTTEGHGPKVTGKSSSTITEERGPKITEKPQL